MAGIKKKRKKLGGDSAAKRARIEQQSADQEEIEVVSAHADAVCASRKNINQIRQLNSAAKHPRGPVALAAIQGLQRVWLQWIADGSFDFHAAAGSSKKNEGSAAGALTAWMRQQYIQYIQLLLEKLNMDDITLQAAAMHVLMSFVRVGPGGALDSKLLYHVVRHTVWAATFMSGLMPVFVKQYWTEYEDVCTGGLLALQQLARHLCSDKPLPATADELFSSPPERSPEDVAVNVMALLLSLPAADEPRDNFAAVELESKHADPLKHAASNCWLQALKLPLPVKSFQTLLRVMHSKVLPWLRSPLLLSDFLTRSYDVGGLTSVLALSGLFELITVHNLEYPDFYQRLYQLLEPEALELPYKSRFWQLIDTCLVASTKLPAYLVAAFAKKLAQLALRASPSGAMVASSIIFNMIKKHSAVRVLVQRDALGPTPYDAAEPDHAKCGALSSSLWELSALKQHYCPEVASIAKAFSKDFESKTLKGFTPEEFVELTYEELLDAETNRRVKEIPLAFEKVTHLFHQDIFKENWDFGTEDN